MGFIPFFDDILVLYLLNINNDGALSGRKDDSKGAAFLLKLFHPLSFLFFPFESFLS